MTPDILGVFVPIIAIVMGIGFAMLNSVTSHRRRSQALEQRHKERLAAIDKGIELPPDANDPDAQLELARALRPPRFLLRGLVFGGIGAALILGWAGPGRDAIGGIGWVLVAVGVAYLVYYAVEGRKERDRLPPAVPPPG